MLVSKLNEWDKKKEEKKKMDSDRSAFSIFTYTLASINSFLLEKNENNRKDRKNGTVKEYILKL